eukprot:1658069-Pleurochrysis_carterae.AAC.3
MGPLDAPLAPISQADGCRYMGEGNLRFVISSSPAARMCSSFAIGDLDHRADARARAYGYSS